MPKSEYASRDLYDVWLPELAPSEELVKIALSTPDERQWQTFVRRYRAEMKQPAANRLLSLLAALSHQTTYSVGCYCADETRSVRSSRRCLTSMARASNNAHQDARGSAKAVTVSEDTSAIDLVDGRTIVVPLARYPRLWHGTLEECKRVDLFGDGAYIHRLDLDGNLTVAGLLVNLAQERACKPRSDPVGLTPAAAEHLAATAEVDAGLGAYEYE